MISFIRNSEIDKTKWNATIQRSLFPTIFADFDFLSIASPQWCALIKDDYEYVMPLPIKSKLSIKYIYTPHFISRLGLFSSHPITAELVQDFLNHIPSSFRQIDLFLNPENRTTNSIDSPVEMISYRLKTEQPHTLITQHYSENTRRNIKYAEKQNLTYCTNLAPQEVIALFEKGRGKDKAVNYVKKDYQLLLKLVDYALEKDTIDIVGARDEDGNLLAGAFFLKDHTCTWFWFSGRDLKEVKKRAMFFVVNEYLKSNENKTLYLDFNGSMNENIARFYKGFGAEKYTYPLLIIRKYSYLSPFIKIYKTLIK